MDRHPSPPDAPTCCTSTEWSCKARVSSGRRSGDGCTVMGGCRAPPTSVPRCIGNSTCSSRSCTTPRKPSMTQPNRSRARPRQNWTRSRSPMSLTAPGSRIWRVCSIDATAKASLPRSPMPCRCCSSPSSERSALPVGPMHVIRSHRVADGISTLAERLAGEIGDSISMNEALIAVHHGDGSVVVTTSKRRIEADHVVLACSLVPLRDVSLRPAASGSFAPRGRRARLRHGHKDGDSVRRARVAGRLCHHRRSVATDLRTDR